MSSGDLSPARACCRLHSTPLWISTAQVRELGKERNRSFTPYNVTSFETASFLAQSCGIQLAVFILQSASHILFHFTDSSFPPNFRPKASAAMQSLISSAHTHLASPLFTTHLPSLALRLRSWSRTRKFHHPPHLNLLNPPLPPPFPAHDTLKTTPIKAKLFRAFSLDASCAFAIGDAATAAVNSRAAV